MDALIMTKKPRLKKPYLIVAWPGMGEVAFKAAEYLIQALKAQEFVEAARALSKSDIGIMTQHILPNCIAPLTVETSLSIAAAIITESALSFLGLGVRPPTPSWGQMIADGRSEVFNAPWIVIFPGLAIMITVLGYNLLGDGLRDALDPRL